jgi:hypothetical protein
MLQWRHQYGNMTNISESFNHVLKGACTMHVSALVQIIFYKRNRY